MFSIFSGHENWDISHKKEEINIWPVQRDVWSAFNCIFQEGYLYLIQGREVDIVLKTEKKLIMQI